LRGSALIERPREARLTLARLLRGPHRRAIEDVAALLPSGVQIEDAAGTTLLSIGSLDPDASTFPLFGGADGATSEHVLGIVRGGVGADRVARLVRHLYEREGEKLALAQETLGRYKELTVLYDLGESLSRVLDVGEIAARVVQEAQRFLQASEATLFLVAASRTELEPIAAAGERAAVRLSLDGGALEARVVRSGQAELVEDAPRDDGTFVSLLCAPLRSGDEVFGILRVASEPRRPADVSRARWTAGELKLVTSLAGSSATAISHAMLHRDQLHKHALRSRIDRFVSPTFVEEALAGTHERAREGLAVLFCDLTEPGLAAETSSAQDVLDALGAATCAALAVLLAHGATVDAEHPETLVAVFPNDDGFAASALAATDAALALGLALSRSHGGPLARVPGVGIARGDLAAGGDTAGVFRGIGVAAGLQSTAGGRVLVDPDVAQALHGRRECVALRRPDAPGYEVRT